jgi:hypothetical protein
MCGGITPTYFFQDMVKLHHSTARIAKENEYEHIICIATNGRIDGLSNVAYCHWHWPIERTVCSYFTLRKKSYTCTYFFKECILDQTLVVICHATA